MAVLSTYLWAVVRKSEGKEIMLMCEVGHDPDKLRAEVDRVARLTPAWAEQHPVVRIVRVKVTECEGV